MEKDRSAIPLQVRGENLLEVEEFKYLCVLFISNRRGDCKISRRLGAAEVKWSVYQTVVAKGKLS